MSIFGLLMGHFVERRKYNRKLLIWYSFVFLFLCALIFIPKDFLAGFLALRGDASFMVRYGPQISFWGLLAGLVGLLITAVTSTVRSKPKNEMD
jgi:membrane protein implicated in regulation of membrane protease activity